MYELAYPGYPGDASFYIARGRSGRVLYLGVGTGRIFGPLANLNQNAFGVESSEEMHRLFRRRYPNHADLIFNCDACDLSSVGDCFDTILAPYSFLQVVGRERLPDLLLSACNRLKAGGVFITDMFSPYTIPFRETGIETNICHSTADVRITIHITYDHLTQKMHELATLERDGEPSRVLDMRLDYFFPFEVTSALFAAGFATVEVMGGYGNSLFDPATNQVLVYEAVKH